MIDRYLEFFEGANNRLSMTRLLCFLSFFPASYVVIATLSENALGWYLGAYVLGYVGGKGLDAFGNRAPTVEGNPQINVGTDSVTVKSMKE